MTPEREAQMREMFIQYRLSEGDEPFDLRLSNAGEFADHETWEQWQVWLACARALEPKWQPIDTAPKTGRTLLLGYPNRMGNWRTVRGQWMSEAYIAECWEDPDDVEPGWFETAEEADDEVNCWRVEPTHWMPLPEQPTAAMSAALEDGNATD